MELRQVQYFLAVAKLLNFTRAAEECDVTQPALTKAMQKLERELGGTLIHRERQLTHLTELGKMVLPMLEGLQAAADAAKLRAREYQGRKIAPLRIGLTPSISAGMLMAPLADITHRIPGLHLEFSEVESHCLIRKLLDGDINAALIGDHNDFPDRIDHWPLYRERYVALMSPGHPLASFSPLPPEALAETVLLERIGSGALDRLRQICLPEAAALNIRHRSLRFDHLQHMAAAGLGVIVAPEHMPRLPSLRAIPIDGDPLWREVRLLAMAGRGYSPALAAFLKAARRHDWEAAIAETTTLAIEDYVCAPQIEPAKRLATA